MEVSPLPLSSMLFKSNSVSSEYYHRLQPSLFEKNPEDFCIVIQCFSRGDISKYGTLRDRIEAPALSEKKNGEKSGTYTLQLANVDVEKLQSMIEFTNHDFRVFYLCQWNSYSRLRISNSLFNQLLHWCQVFPKFREYTIGFGCRNREAEVGPPAIVFRPLSFQSTPPGFECAYILRYVEFTNRDDNNPWSLRQYAVYHKYTPLKESPRSTWIMLGMWQRARAVLESNAKDGNDLMKMHPFELHLSFIDAAISSWREYLINLESQAVEVGDQAMVATIDPHPDTFVTVDFIDCKKLKALEDDVINVMVCLHSTSDTLSTFGTMYDQLFSAIAKTSDTTIDTIALIINEKRNEIIYTQKRAESLLSKIRNSQTIISALLEHRTGNNLKGQIKALRSLESEAKDENSLIRELAQKASRESSNVFVLTFINTIYLPFTLVLSFYSTEFVHQNETNGSIVVSRSCWIMLAISLPIVMVTCAIWFAWIKYNKLVHQYTPLGSLKEELLK